MPVGWQRRQLHPQQRDPSQRDIALIQGGGDMAELRASPTQMDRDAVADREEPFEDGVIARLPPAERFAFEQRHASPDECAIAVGIGMPAIAKWPGQLELGGKSNG